MTPKALGHGDTVVNHFANARRIASQCLSLALLVVFCSACSQELPTDGGQETVNLSGRPFTLTLSMTNNSRSRGLGGIRELPPEKGMLFVFPDAAPRGFWMYDCLMDIDIAFIDPLGHVTAIHTMPMETPRGENESIVEYEARLPRYRSGFPAQYAIELAPGTFDQLGISRGDRLSLDMDRMKAIAEISEPTPAITGSR